MAMPSTRVRRAPAYAGRRVPRMPVHEWNLRARPYQIQPCLIAPVLAGETLKSAMFQTRVVSDPIKNPLIGWWKEYFFFYVKHRDLDARDKLTEMMLDPEWTSASNALDEAASVPYYSYATTINWTRLCLKRVVEEYFRNEGESWDEFTLDGLPVASVNKTKWMDSILPSAAYDEVDVDIDMDADGTTTVTEVTAAMAMYEMLKNHGLTEMTYDEYLATHGVRPATVELHRPELLRNVSDWTYPSNTVDPATGTPSSALSWSVRERIDKDRFFKEPGFILGVSITRPKVYFSKQRGSAVGMLNDALSWLPAVMTDRAETSLKHFADLTGPLGDVTDAGGYWVDVRDLFLHGDQFVNYDPATATDANMIGLPTASLQKRYAASADVDALFKTTTANKIREDGVMSLVIHGHQRDHTATT